MREQFVTYGIALKLKELGFDDECDAIFNPIFLIDGCWTTTNAYIKKFSKTEKGVCAAPLWQQAIDWLREKHKLIILVYMYDEFRDDYFSYQIIRRRGNIKDNYPYKSYEEARKQAILKALTLIK